MQHKKTLLILIFGLILIYSCNIEKEGNIGQTIITKWQGDKRSAVSITYDDGIINQFTVAKPIMDKFKMPGTFYIITGKIDGSEKGKFIGRPKEKIIEETKYSKTNENNFFERASLIAFTGTTEAIDFHSRAGSLYEAGNRLEAYKILDEGYSKIRRGKIKNLNEAILHDNVIDTTTWQDLKNYAKEGHEIASHTVTHARLAVLDEKNLLYELEQSKKDIGHFLGEKYTFSAECPYGTENERVMEYAHKLYPSLRNRMPELYLEEINRGSDKKPEESKKEYVQWQRGPLTNTEMDKMKEWVDTILIHDNIWLVLVFHGVDGVGWEPKTGEELEDYFKYINDRKEQIWTATFADVTKYIRERKSTKIEIELKEERIKLHISSNLDPNVYDVPITLKTYVPKSWKNVAINKDDVIYKTQTDTLGSYVTYSVMPNERDLVLEEALQNN